MMKLAMDNNYYSLKYMPCAFTSEWARCQA